MPVDPKKLLQDIRRHIARQKHPVPVYVVTLSQEAYDAAAEHLSTVEEATPYEVGTQSGEARILRSDREIDGHPVARDPEQEDDFVVHLNMVKSRL